MSAYLIEPIRENLNFKGAVRNGHKQPNGKFSKETAVLTHNLKVMGETQVVLDF